MYIPFASIDTLVIVKFSTWSIVWIAVNIALLLATAPIILGVNSSTCCKVNPCICVGVNAAIWTGVNAAIWTDVNAAISIGVNTNPFGPVNPAGPVNPVVAITTELDMPVVPIPAEVTAFTL